MTLTARAFHQWQLPATGHCPLFILAADAIKRLRCPTVPQHVHPTVLLLCHERTRCTLVFGLYPYFCCSPHLLRNMQNKNTIGLRCRQLTKLFNLLQALLLVLAYITYLLL